MQQLHDANTGTGGPVETTEIAELAETPETTAAQLLEVIPSVQRTIRTLMREGASADLSVPQFRALAYIRRHPGASLSGVAEHVGLSVAAASRLIDGLVGRGFVEREVSPTDRRFVTLRLSPAGTASWTESRAHATRELEIILAQLSEDERAAILRALDPLRRAFIRPEAERRENTTQNMTRG